MTVDVGPFTKVPNKYFGSGKGQTVGPSATVLYFALCENGNRNSSNTFKASDKALASETSLSPRTLRNARIRLREHGLIAYSREPGQSFAYELLPQNLNWLPRENRPRNRMRPRAMAVIRARSEPQDTDIFR